MIKAFALWRATSKRGETYLQGNWGDLKVMIFENKKKEPGSSQPDYRAFVAERDNGEKKEEKKAPGYKPDDGFKYDDGDVPF